MPSHTVKKLTDNLIKGLKPEGKEYTVSCGGLELRIYPTGTKSWTFPYRGPDGKAGQTLTIGRYPLMGIHEANQAVLNARRLLERGVDPNVHKKAGLAPSSGEATVNDVWESFKRQHFKNLQPRSIKDYETEMERFVLPKWGKLPIRELRRRDGVLLMERMVKDGCHTAANHIRSHLSKIWNFALDREDVEANPFTELPKLGDSKVGNRFLTDEEIPLFWFGLDKIQSRQARCCLRMLLLAGRRETEVVALRWEELDLEEGVWYLTPAKRRKKTVINLLPVIVPLPPMTVEMLKEQKKRTGSWKHVFPSEFDPTRHYTVNALNQVVRAHYKDTMGIETKFTPHDLRRSCSTGLARIGYHQEIIDKVLCHKLGGISAVYNCHDYVEQRGKALNAWARHIQELLEISKAGTPKSKVKVRK